MRTSSACESLGSPFVLRLVTHFCSEGITATDIAFVAKNTPMLLSLPPGSKGKSDSMRAAATARAGGIAFPMQFVYVSSQAFAMFHPAGLRRFKPHIFKAIRADGCHWRRRQRPSPYERLPVLFQKQQGISKCEANRHGQQEVLFYTLSRSFVALL
jgi:hypothetical protein